jgi:hypothetical protein
VVWLRSLGLGKYEAIFRENDIDEAVLPSLTHENLKELGVASFGHRVKLLDAIGALRGDASGKAPSVHAASILSAPPARSSADEGRKQPEKATSATRGETGIFNKLGRLPLSLAVAMKRRSKAGEKPTTGRRRKTPAKRLSVPKKPVLLMCQAAKMIGSFVGSPAN